MKDTIPEDSDELFYSTSSGDDSIPDITSKSDTDNEASLKCKPTMAKHRFLDDESAPQHPVCDSTTPVNMEFD